jgi:6-phosphofructokinase 1
MANAIIGQSGGPTSVINSSLAGAIDAARSAASIDRIYGMRWGIEGFMADEVIDLSAEPAETIQQLRRTPSSILGSCRHKLTDEDFPVIFERLKEYDIDTMFLIGGNDTMDTIHRVSEYAASQGYALRGVGIPKTVDNDLYGTDHTPGYASAGRYVALSTRQAGRLARDMQKVDQFFIAQWIGRDAGWLTAAGALASDAPADAPHLVYLPERVFEKDRFLADVEACYKQHGYVGILCGEGIKYADGTPVSSAAATDKFNNVEFGAMGGASVALNMHRMISEAFGWRGEFQITESLPMSGIDRAVPQDLEEAYRCGQRAVELAEDGQSGVMVSLKRVSNDPYECTTDTVPLAEVAVRAKPMPDDFINEAGNYPSEKFIEYARPLIGPMEPYARLSGQKATKK